jgi:hypothetical protein
VDEGEEREEASDGFVVDEPDEKDELEEEDEVISDGS